MTNHNRQLGQRGERLAETLLVEIGANILTRNYRCHFGEIDLVLDHDGDLVAVEVKTRSVLDPETPEEAVTRRQIRRIANALTAYADDVGRLDSHWRVDVVAVQVDAAGRLLRLEHLRDAFEG